MKNSLIIMLLCLLLANDAIDRGKDVQVVLWYIGWFIWMVIGAWEAYRGEWD